MKAIIAGSRVIDDYSLIKNIIEEAKKQFDITEVVCGMAPGVDLLGKRWAEENDIPVKEFPADWDDIYAQGAIVKINQFGKRYNARAGFTRNKIMIDYISPDGLLIAIVRGDSKGTRNTIELAKNKKIAIIVKEV